MLEIAAAIGIQYDKTRRLFGWLLFLFLILILSADITASLQQIDFQKETFDGPDLKVCGSEYPCGCFSCLGVLDHLKENQAEAVK